jgi:Fic family protein
MEGLGFPLQSDAVLRTLTEDVVKSSDIEGEALDADQVRSSVARRLGMEVGGPKPADRRVDGVVEMMLDATQRYDQPLTLERLFGWHAALFPTGPVLKAAQAHLWFVTIHPFDDGNGRIARAIADMALARSEGSPQRFYSMSAQIRAERADYYRVLEQTQRATLDVTPWMEWFLGCLTRAIQGARITLTGVIGKARIWEQLRDVPLNDRERLIINHLLDGFEGKLTTSKWAALTKASHDTALRDMQSLVERGVLVRNTGGGRSTSYSLANS